MLPVWAVLPAEIMATAKPQQRSITSGMGKAPASGLMTPKRSPFARRITGVPPTQSCPASTGISAGSNENLALSANCWRKLSVKWANYAKAPSEAGINASV